LGIPGWEKVDRLAQALVKLSGLSVSNEQARNIQLLYSQLHEYDKKPLTFTPCQRPTLSRGRFGRSKRGYTTVEQMKRFLRIVFIEISYCSLKVLLVCWISSLPSQQEQIGGGYLHPSDKQVSMWEERIRLVTV